MGLWQILKGEQPGLLKSVLHYSPCAGKAHSVRGGMKGALEILRNS